MQTLTACNSVVLHLFLHSSIPSLSLLSKQLVFSEKGTVLEAAKEGYDLILAL